MASIEQDILIWMKGRPAWQRNLLKRIARGEAIDDAYIASVVQAIVEKKVTLEVPELAAADLPTGTAGGNTVQLESIGELPSRRRPERNPRRSPTRSVAPRRLRRGRASWNLHSTKRTSMTKRVATTTLNATPSLLTGLPF